MGFYHAQFDLDLSVQRELWATQPHNEPILDQAYRTSSVVYLIFSVNKSGEFFGYAKCVFRYQSAIKSLLMYIPFSQDEFAHFFGWATPSCGMGSTRYARAYSHVSGHISFTTIDDR